jgi:release factor glutamine methyltransferase
MITMADSPVGVPVRQLLARATDRLRSAGIETPEQDARLLLAHAADVEQARLAILDVVSGTVERNLLDLLECRASRIPLQHITGLAYFRHLVLSVGPGVFVPRPETEVMAGWASDELRALATTTPRVVDLCAGSGAIAKAISTEVPGSEVYAVEISVDAVRWAEQNLGHTGVQLVVADMAAALPELDGTVDLVIANPPYIPPEEQQTIEPEARDHDPAVALFSGREGLAAIHVVIATAARLLRRAGLLCFEHGETQYESAPALVKASGAFAEVADHRDLTGRSRFTTAVRRV